MNKKFSLSAFILLILAEVMVGINIVGSKYLIAFTPLLFLLTMRFLLAAFFLLPLHLMSPFGRIGFFHLCRNLNKRDWVLLVTQALCAGILFNLLMVFGLRYTEANAAGIISSTLPGLIVIGCWLFLKEKLTLKKLACVGLSVLGLIVISVHPGSNHSGGFKIGNLLVFLALIPEAAYYVLTKLQANRLPIFLMSAVINAINGLLLLPAMLFMVNVHQLHFSFLDWIVLITVGISSGLFYVFWYLGANKVDAIMASLSTAAMPIATVFIAWFALGEVVGLWQLAGMGLVIAAILAYGI